MFARADLSVVEVPQLWALALRVPLPARVAKRQDPLLCPRFVLLARAPPMQASKRCSAIASSRVTF